MRILITRPAEDSATIAARLAAIGPEGVVVPLLTPRFDMDVSPDLAGVQAVLITSANGVRAFVQASARRDLPVFAVGPQTAALARQAGFVDVRDADGDVHALAACAARWAKPDGSALVHVCSHEAPGTLTTLLARAGFVVRAMRLYRMEVATALPDTARVALERGRLDAAMFFSPRSAGVFRDLLLPVDESLVAPLAALCISTNTAKALAPLTFKAVRVAAHPNQDAMLALVE
jgi:uroporphyrinogen-III synthase